MKFQGFAAGIAATFTLLSTTSAFAVTEISWWHAMTGANNEVVETLSKEFNESQTEYKVVPVFKGTYPEALNAGIAAFRAKQPPAILQVFDAGTGVMMGAEGAIKPVAEILSMGGAAFDKSQYLPGIVSYYSKPDGTMLSFPYNSSSPILYYNKDIFQKAGLDVDNPPKTWPEVWDAAKKIKTSGAAPCGFTSTWLTWIHTENFAAWNNLPFGTQRERHRRHRCRAEDQFADLRQALPGARRPRQGRHLQIWRPHLRGQADLPRRRMRHLHRIVGRPRRHRQVGHELRHRPAALRAGGRGRAAEHHSRRRQPVGVRRQVRRAVQGRRGVLQLPVADRRSRPGCIRSPAICR